MNKKIRAILIITILILSVLLVKQFQHRNDELYAVNLKNKINNNLVSILVSDGSDNYTKYEGSTFPSNVKYAYNGELSKCQDNNGNVIEGILSYNETTGKVNIKTKKTTYCYLYFDKKSLPISEELIASGELWQSGLEGDGYRYTGSGKATASTSPNNFICFGTTSLSECKANEEKYMYRIIGVFPDESGEQHLKLIKSKQLGKYKWHSDQTTDVSWESSDLYKGLNGISGGSYSNLFIGNTTYDYLQDNTWSNKIADWKWTATNTLTNSNSGLNYSSITTEQMYLHEMNRNAKTSNIGEWTYPVAKIGLMYASDYQMSLGSSSLTMTGSSDEAKTGWLHTSNMDSADSSWEWLPTRGGLYKTWNGGWKQIYWSCFLWDGGMTCSDLGGVSGELIVRPVFYLNSNVSISDGTGRYDNPYLIKY